MSYLDALKKSNNVGVTENGAKSNKSTLDPVLDFFSKAGAMRDNPAGAVELFARAYAKDPLAAVRALFYLRDVRGGQGERFIFRACFTTLAVQNQALVEHLNSFVPEYGRWDDIVVTPQSAAWMKAQIEADEQDMAEGKQVSLLAKWLPSENASSKNTKQAARVIATLFDMTPTEYRKRIVALRKHIQLLEQKMSTKAWGEIDYSKLPSQAHRKHIKAFKRNDESRYNSFLEAVEKGEATLNADTLFTYEVFDAIDSDEKAANAMWKSLPDYTDGKNALVVADVSGSMSGRPMSISVSLALYFAEHNKGAFANHFMTFSDDSQLVEVLGNTLADKLRFIENAEWEMSTNLQSAFDSILEAAVKANAEPEELPSTLYIISDMQFNACVEDGNATNLEVAKAKFAEHGYKLPHVVFWNVNAYGTDSPATIHDENTTLISGSSASTFRYALEGKTPLESMHDILNSERYAPITLEPVEKSLEDIPF